MRYSNQKRRIPRKVGLPPGTVFPSDTGIEKIPWQFEMFVFNAEGFEERRITSEEQLMQVELPDDKVMWLNIDHSTDAHLLQAIGEKFDIHSLILEDVSHPEQRPKIEEYEEHLFYSLKMVHYSTENVLQLEQISVVLGKNYVLSFQEKPGDVFDPVRERIRHGSGRLRRRTADYLAYALFDVVVDHYFLLLDDISASADEVEELLRHSPKTSVLEEIEDIRRDLLFQIKAISPLKEAIAKLIRSRSPLISNSTRNYLNDLQDNTLEILESLELNRQLNNSHRDMYFSSLTHKMNEVMKSLTIVATIFIPLTFVVGIYGMNFEYMPELKMKWAYFIVLGIMTVIAGGSVIYFRRRGWM
jgi:magnesium transporter